MSKETPEQRQNRLDAKADWLNDVERDLRDIEVLENPDEGRQPW
jgi:hypothetical protein